MASKYDAGYWIGVHDYCRSCRGCVYYCANTRTCDYINIEGRARTIRTDEHGRRYCDPAANKPCECRKTGTHRAGRDALMKGGGQF